MQFYLNGYNPGDPDILTAAPGAEKRAGRLPEAVDVLIVGSGPAGTLLAAQLSAFPDISTRLVERRKGPLQVGQADGVACRTVEMFEAFGLSDKLMREAYWVNETVFWRPSPKDRSKIVRTGRIQDTEDGLSEFPHLIVNQARLLQYLLDYMHKSPTRLVPDYGLDFVTLKVESEGDHPVVVTLRNLDAGTETSIRAKYVVGCDGARSLVRDAIGAEPHGDFANHAWGVVDMLAVTDFPDIRLKAAIRRRPTKSSCVGRRSPRKRWIPQAVRAAGVAAASNTRRGLSGVRVGERAQNQCGWPRWIQTFAIDGRRAHTSATRYHSRRGGRRGLRYRDEAEGP